MEHRSVNLPPSSFPAQVETGNDLVHLNRTTPAMRLAHLSQHTRPGGANWLAERSVN